MVKHVERNIWEFTEGRLCVRGERNDMLYIAELFRNAEGTVGDLRYQMEYEFDIDGIRSMDDEAMLEGVQESANKTGRC